MSRLLVLLLAFTLFGCDKAPTSPRRSGQVLLDVTVANPSGSPTVLAVVTNDRATAIRHMAGCSYWAPGMTLSFLDASGATLYGWDIRLVPLCGDFISELRPGERVEGTASLNGTLYTAMGDPVTMQPGTYTAVVTFTWKPADDPSGPWYVREQRVEFDWPLPSP